MINFVRLILEIRCIDRLWRLRSRNWRSDQSNDMAIFIFLCKNRWSHWIFSDLVRNSSFDFNGMARFGEPNLIRFYLWNRLDFDRGATIIQQLFHNLMFSGKIACPTWHVIRTSNWTHLFLIVFFFLILYFNICDKHTHKKTWSIMLWSRKLKRLIISSH